MVRPITAGVPPAPASFCFLVEQVMPQLAGGLSFSDEDDRRILGAVARHLPADFEEHLRRAVAGRGEELQALLEQLEQARRTAAADLAAPLRSEAERVLQEARRLEVSELWSAYRALERYGVLGESAAQTVAGLRSAASAARDDAHMGVARKIAEELLGTAVTERDAVEPVEAAALPETGPTAFLRDDPGLAGFFGRLENDLGFEHPTYQAPLPFEGFRPGETVTTPGLLLAAYTAAEALAPARAVEAGNDWITVWTRAGRRGNEAWSALLSVAQDRRSRFDAKGNLIVWSNYPDVAGFLRRVGIRAAYFETSSGWRKYLIDPKAATVK